MAHTRDQRPFTTAAAPRRRYAFGTTLLAASVMLLAGTGHGGVQEPDKVDATRAVLEQWVATERLCYQAEQELRVKRELLESQIAVVQRELDATRSRIADAERQLSETGGERTELEAEAARQAAAADGLAERVAALETRTRALVSRLPAAALARVETLIARLPADSAETKLGLGDRYLNVVGILNGFNKFQLELSLTSEVRRLPDGSGVAVSVLYLGLSQAYYVSADRSVAGTGTAGPDGWIWTPANQAAEEIARAIAIYSGEAEAGFVRLPLND